MPRTVTLGSAVLPSDSDPEDEDYEEPNSSQERGRSKASGRCSQGAGLEADNGAAIEKKERAAFQTWAEMHSDAMAAARRRPPCAPLDALSRQFQIRHPRPPKQCSRKAIWAELKKYSCVVLPDAPPMPTAADLKRKVRSAAVAARTTGSSGAARRQFQSAMVVVEDVVRFAGEHVTVKRRVAVGSSEEQHRLQEQKRRRQAQVGGRLAALDAFLGKAGAARDVSVVEKSDLDWRQHKDSTGLDGLDRDPRAGALERRAFLARARGRSEAEAAAGRARAAAALRRGQAAGAS